MNRLVERYSIIWRGPKVDNLNLASHLLSFILISSLFLTCSKDHSTNPTDSSLITGWEIYDINNSGLPHDWIRSIEVDSKQNVWIGTYFKGIAKFDGSNWEAFTSSSSGLPSDTIYDIAIDHNDNLWVGTSNGFGKFDGRDWTVYNQTNAPLPVRHISEITVDKDGVAWFGCGHTEEGGLMTFDNGNWELFTPSNSQLPCRIIESIFVDENNVKWIGTSQFQGNGGVVKIDDNNWTVYHKDNSILPYNAVENIVSDTEGNIWVGMTALFYLDANYLHGSLLKFDGRTWKEHKPANSGKTSNRVSALASDKNGKIWLATAPDGLFREELSVYNGKDWVVLSSLDSDFPHAFILDLAADDKNKIWAASDQGVIVIEQSE